MGGRRVELYCLLGYTYLDYFVGTYLPSNYKYSLMLLFLYIMPHIKRMFDGWHVSARTILVDLLHELLQEMTAVCGADSNWDTLLMQPDPKKHINYDYRN
jgi:hypothetical protein